MLKRLLIWRGQATPDGDARPRQAGDARPRQLLAYNTADARDLFSHLLRRVREGEEIVVAHGGRPVAKLVPYDGEDVVPGMFRARFYAGERPTRSHRRDT